jgi:hypothetical protein
MGTRRTFRTRTVAFRVTETDFAQLQAVAEASQRPLGEWCRDLVLESIRHPAGTPGEQAVVAEVIGMRTIVANLIFAFTSGGTITADLMQDFVSRADGTKLQRAAEFLRQIRNNSFSGQAPQGEKR